MPQLAPKQTCPNCGKSIGRRWKEALCGTCIHELEKDVWSERVPPTEEIKNDIPY